MNANLSRRRMMQALSVAAFNSTLLPAAAAPWPLPEGPGTPKICLELSAGRLSAGTPDEVGMRRVKQLGVDYVLTGGPRIPWQEADIRARIERLKAGGLTLYNMMIGGFPNTLYGRPGRDEEIDNIRHSISAAGRAGLRGTVLTADGRLRQLGDIIVGIDDLRAADRKTRSSRMMTIVTPAGPMFFCAPE